ATRQALTEPRLERDPERFATTRRIASRDGRLRLVRVDARTEVVDLVVRRDHRGRGRGPEERGEKDGGMDREEGLRGHAAPSSPLRRWLLEIDRPLPP